MILVTGATGILGRMIVLELLKQNQVVRASYHHEYKKAALLDSFAFYLGDADLAKSYYQNIHWHATDFANFDSIAEALDGVGEVYHCAGLVSFKSQDRNALWRTNVDFTKNLLYAAQEKEIGKFCHISSVATLDKLNDEFKIDETSDWDSKTSHSDYAMTKFLAEMEVFRAHAEGLNTIIINPSVIIADGQGAQSSGQLYAFHQKYNYALPGETGFVDVRDVAQLSLKLMALNRFGERFICSAEPKTYAWVANRIRQNMGLPKVKTLQKWQIYGLRTLGVLLGWAFPALAVLNRYNLGPDKKTKPYLNQKIVAATNHQFISIETSIDQHTQHYINPKK
jgi:dihydroflavonol-4-reductase